MKHSTLTIVILACLVVALSITMAFTAASSASAQLGNTGVPVRCMGFLAPDGPMHCEAADGTLFGTWNSAPNVLVPAGHYLLVTDFHIGTVVGPIAAEGWRAEIVNSALDSGGPGFVPHIELAGLSAASVGAHFTVPYLVLHEGQYLAVNTISGVLGGGGDVHVSGLLTTNVNYLPLTSR